MAVRPQPSRYAPTEAEPITDLPRNHASCHPLSHGQQALWFLHKLAPESGAYNVAHAVCIRAAVEVEVMERALQHLVDRHSALRTRLHEQQGEMVQCIHASMPVDFTHQDRTGCSRAELDEQMSAAAWRPFDLEAGPPLRVALFTRGPQEHYALLVMHHIITDFWSVAVLVRELGECYAAAAEGRLPVLPDLPLRFVDLVARQRAALHAAEGERHWQYWQQQLAGELPVLHLPLDHARPAVPSYRGGAERLQLSPELTRALKRMARSHGATLYVTLLAAIQVVLARASGQKEIIIGSPVAERSRETAGIVGYLLSPTPMRTRLAGQPTFSALLAQVKQTVREAVAHRQYPLPLLVERLQLDRDLSRAPLFQVIYTHQPAHMADAGSLAPFALGVEGYQVKMGALPLESVAIAQRFVQFDLAFSSAEVGDEVVLLCQYSTDLFEGATIKRLLQRLSLLLESIAADPGQRIEAIPLLTAAERQQVLVQWNDTALPYAKARCVHQLFEAQAEENPAAVALIDGQEQLSYGELNRRANQLAHYLRHIGVGPEMVVGIYHLHSVQLLVAILGILKAGAAYLPLDTRQPAERLLLILRNAGATAVLTQERLQQGLRGYEGAILRLDADHSRIAQCDTTNPAVQVWPQNLAYVLYTSGSTGTPKGVLTTHANLVSEYAAWEHAYGLGTEVTCICQLASPSFAVFQSDWVRALCSGSKLLLCSSETVLTPHRLYQAMVSAGVDFAEFVPPVLRNLLHYLDETRQSLAFLRALVLGSDRWYAQEHDALQRYVGQQTRLIHSFGLTETTVDSAYFEQRTVTLSPGQLTPIGRPFANVQLYILNDYLLPVPTGVIGELVIGGDGLARGYLGDPARTAERFVPNPFYTAADGAHRTRLYRTGDLARHLPDGNVQFLGRLDHQVKVRGFRVELGEIETALRQHPGVREAVVAAVPHALGDARIVAYLVPAQQPIADGAPHQRYKLPNGLEVVSLNPAETHQLHQEICEEQRYLRHGLSIRPGDIIFDVGAHIGIFTLFAQQLAKQVAIYAFEPAPQAFAALERNVALHGVNARLFQIGLSQQAGSARFTFYPRSAGSSTLYPDLEQERAVLRRTIANQLCHDVAASDELMLNGEAWLAARFAAEQVRCSLTTLSQVIREQQVERIDLLKVVVQKSEYDLLAGIAEEDWPKIRQVVIAVYDLQQRLAAISAMLSARGYAVAVEQAPRYAETMLHLVYGRRPERHDAAEQRPAHVPVLTEPAFAVDEIQRFLRDRLPDYMMPSQFLILRALPLTSSGKIDRRTLPEPEPPRPELAESFVPPRTATEVALAAIWCEVLGLHQVGMQDHFFRLGGHSVLAAQLLARIRQALAVDLPMQSIFEAPTLAELAASVERAASRPQAVGAAPLIDDRIVQMQLGGAALPLFLVPPVAGSPFAYVDLVRHMGAARSIYGLQSVGLNGQQQPLRTIEEIAARHIAAMRAVQAAGPYQLIGYSMGGLVAFEMARQLQAQGERIGLLALLDTGGVDATYRDLFRIISRALRTGQLHSLVRQAKAALAMLPRAGLKQGWAWLRLYRANRRALRRYQAGAYAGGAVLFRASENHLRAGEDPAQFWVARLGGGLQTEVVAGGHFTMMQEPCAAALAARLRAQLDRLQEGGAAARMEMKPRDW